MQEDTTVRLMCKMSVVREYYMPKPTMILSNNVYCLPTFGFFIGKFWANLCVFYGVNFILAVGREQISSFCRSVGEEKLV